MSVNDVPSITGIQYPENTANSNDNGRESVCIVDDISNVEQQNLEILRCFVCDVKVQGRRYSLATCKTQNSRTRVIEKLGELVGERYVVVISEDDVICRSCANLINTLDRLESEMRGVKGAVLRYLERKYSLAEGELISCSNVPRIGQTPQITRRDSQSTDYYSRKRGAISPDNGDGSSKKSKKSNVLMQCNKCRYTTLYNTFMVHHMRQHTEQKIRCDKCSVQFSILQMSNHRCKDHEFDNNSMETENPEEEPQAIQTAPLETIELAGNGDDIDDDVTTIPVMTIPSNIESSLSSSKDKQIQLISLTNSNALQFPKYLSNEGSLREGQPLLMRVIQQFAVDDDLEQTSLVPGINSDVIVRTKENNTAKQMLTLTEDGSLEMIAADCWNDVNNTIGDSDTTL